jgi:hypothetical protein
MKKNLKKTRKLKSSKPGAKNWQKLAELKSERFDYCENHQIIIDEMVKFMASKGYPPTQIQIAEKTGLSRYTVGKHCKEITLTNIVPNYQAFTPRVLTGLWIKASKGDPAACKLWFQIVNGWAEKTKSELSGTDGKPLFDGLDDLSEEQLDKEYKQLCKEIQRES